jgi:hypothetical protein
MKREASGVELVVLDLLDVYLLLVVVQAPLVRLLSFRPAIVWTKALM